MNHPNSEEWMGLLYGEVDAVKRTRLEGHLRDCAECQASVASWRRTMKGLDTYELTFSARAPSATRSLPRFILKWGIAAMFILGAGFGLGRLSKPASDIEQLRSALLPEIRGQLRHEFNADLLAALGSAELGATNQFRQELRQAFVAWAATQNATITAQAQESIAALSDSIDSRRAEDRRTILAAFGLLRKNLETVAVVADSRFQHAENQLGQLISYAQPAGR